MATLILTFDTGTVPLAEINDLFAAAYNYQANVPDPGNPGQTMPNPETKAQFSRRQCRRFILDVVNGERRRQAIQAAQGAVTDHNFAD